jgi:hypothetical protein
VLLPESLDGVEHVALARREIAVGVRFTRPVNLRVAARAAHQTSAWAVCACCDASSRDAGLSNKVSINVP